MVRKALLLDSQSDHHSGGETVEDTVRQPDLARRSLCKAGSLMLVLDLDEVAELEHEQALVSMLVGWLVSESRGGVVELPHPPFHQHQKVRCSSSPSKTSS